MQRGDVNAHVKPTRPGVGGNLMITPVWKYYEK